MEDKNNNTTPTSPEFDKVKVAIERLGIEDFENLDHLTIRDRVLSNPELIGDFEKEIKSKQDIVLVNKLKKVLQKHTGISEEDIKDDVDFEKLIIKSLSIIGKNNTNDSLQDIFREKELQYQAKIEEYEQTLSKLKEEANQKVSAFKEDVKATTYLKSLPLNPHAKENINELKATALTSAKSKYKFKEVDGQFIAYNDKGEKIFKPGTKYPFLLEDAIKEYVDKFGFIQNTDVNVDPMKAKQPSALHRVHKF